MAPSSAKAKHASSEINAPATQTSRNSQGVGALVAIWPAVRNIPEPMIPPTSSSTESVSESPRTRVAFSGCAGAGWDINRAPGSRSCRRRLSGYRLPVTFGQQPVEEVLACLAPDREPSGAVSSRPQSFLHRLTDGVVLILDALTHVHTLSVAVAGGVADFGEVEVEDDLHAVDSQRHHEVSV